MQEVSEKSRKWGNCYLQASELPDKEEVGVLADAHLSITRNVLPYYSRCFVLAIIWSCTSVAISVK